MNEREFLSLPFRERVRAAVERVEAQTGAEVVVCVRARCGAYDGARHVTGALGGFAMLLVLLFHPMEFAVSAMPSAVAAAYLLGYAIAGRSPRLLRWLTRQRVREAQVSVAARAAFLDLGVVETRKRVGVLVFVSLLERRVELLGDRGLDRARLGAGWERVGRTLGESIARRLDPGEFLAELGALGPVLAGAAPPSDDDSDELPNLPAASPEEGDL